MNFVKRWSNGVKHLANAVHFARMTDPRFSLKHDVLNGDGSKNEEEKIVKRIYDETKKAIENAKNQATVKKTTYWIAKLDKEAASLGLKGELLTMTPSTLNAVISSYLLSMKREDGEDFEPSSIHNMFSIVGKYLGDHRYGADLEKDEVFRSAREAKATKVKKN